MKKTLLLTVLILSVVFTVSAYAADITPDFFWNGGSDISYTFRNDTFDYAAGTLPTNETNGFMVRWSALRTALGSARFRCAGTGYTGAATDVITASAVPETEGSSNIVFKITGNQETFLADAGYTGGAASTHAIKFKLSSTVPSTAVVGLSVLGNASNYSAVQTNGTGVFVSNGGVYVNDVTIGEQAWFVPEGTLASDTWYTATTLTEVLADGFVVQNVTITDGTNTWKSGVCKVSEATGVAAFNMVQHYTTGLGDGVVMLDDWSDAVVTAPTKGALSFVPDADKAMRKVYKFVSTVPFDGSKINNDVISVTSSNPEINMAGKYSVSCDGTAIVVTMDETLPLETEFTIAIDPSIMLEMDGGYVAFNYAATAVINSMVQTFTTPSDSELFEVAIAADASTVSFSNISFDEREYIIIASRFDASGKYLETAAKYGTLGARAADGAPVTDSVAVPAFADAAAGDVIKVMVWDNWESMNFFAELRQVTVQ